MSNFKRLPILILVVAALLAAGCSTDKKTAKQAYETAEIILRLGYGQASTNPRHIVAQRMAAWVSEQTNGRVKIELFPGEVLGSDKQMTDLVAEGSLDMVITAHGVAAAYEPKLAILELPFLFQSVDKVGNVLDGPIGEELAKDMPAKGLRLLAYWDNGLRHITNSKHPIETPADLQGLKIRTPESTMTVSICKALGANPAPLPFTEIYFALSQGRFDGQENPLVNIYTAKFNEVQKYLSITNHKYESTPFLINENTWQKLPSDVQGILKVGAKKFAAEHRKLNQEVESKALADLAAQGMIISRPDIQPFREATQVVYNEWSKTLDKELMDKVIAAAQQ